MTDTYEQRITNSDKLLQSIIAMNKRSSSEVDVEYIGGGKRGECSNNSENYIRDFFYQMQAGKISYEEYRENTKRFKVQGGWLRENYKAGSYIQHYWVYDTFEEKHFDVTELNYDDGVYFADDRLYKRMKYLAINSDRLGCYKTYLNNIEIINGKIFLRDEYDNLKEVSYGEIDVKLLLQTEKQHDKFFR